MSTATTAPARQSAGALVDDVVRRFGDRVVLDHLDLSVAGEELVVLLGPSGCGKTTLLRLMAGLDRPDGGTVEVPVRRAIMFQGDRLLPWQRALPNVTLGLHGVFDKAPYTVKFARFSYGPPLVQAAASGDIDLGVVGDVPPITGAATEFGFSVVGVAHYINTKIPEEDIIVPKGSPITTVAQLKGKKIAVPEGSSAHGLLLLALRQAGLTPQDVQMDFLSPAAGATAFASGKVDAWSIWNPQVALAVKQGARILAKGLPPIDQTSNYYVAPNKDLTGPKRAAFIDLFKRLGAEFAWADKHPAQYAQALSQEDAISLADAKAVVPSYLAYIAPVTPADIQAEQTLSDAFLQAGQITKKVDFTQFTVNVLPSGYNNLHPDGS